MRRMLSVEAARFQGFSSDELNALACGDGISEKDLLDLVGNGFSTTVLGAVLLASLTAWRRA